MTWQNMAESEDGGIGGWNPCAVHTTWRYIWPGDPSRGTYLAPYHVIDVARGSCPERSTSFGSKESQWSSFATLYTIPSLSISRSLVLGNHWAGHGSSHFLPHICRQSSNTLQRVCHGDKTTLESVWQMAQFLFELFWIDQQQWGFGFVEKLEIWSNTHWDMNQEWRHEP